MTGLLPILAIGLVAAGILSYTGRWKTWAYRAGFAHCGGFAALFIGIALMNSQIMSIASTWTVFSESFVFFAWGGFNIAAVLGFWWMPAFMLPAWFRDGRDLRRRAERAARLSRRAARRTGERTTSTRKGGHRMGQVRSEDEVLIREVKTPHVVVQYPDFLRTEDHDGAELVLVADEPGLVFRPNIVVTAVPSDRPLTEASVGAIVAAGEQHPGAYVIAVDLFFGSVGFIDGVPSGRVITFTYPGAHLDVIVKKWVFATGEHHVHLAASYLPSQARVAEETFGWIARWVRLTADSDAIRRAACASGDVRPDEEHTARADFAVEDLSFVENPPCANTGAIRATDLPSALAAFGITAEQPKVLTIHTRRGSARGMYTTVSGGAELVVVRSAGASAESAHPTEVNVYAMSAERVATDVVAWVGLSPEFGYGDAWTIPEGEYARQFEDDPGDGSWIEFRMSSGEDWWVVVRIPGRGWFSAAAPADGIVTMQPFPPVLIFDSVLRQLDRRLAGDRA